MAANQKKGVIGTRESAGCGGLPASTCMVPGSIVAPIVEGCWSAPATPFPLGSAAFAELAVPHPPFQIYNDNEGVNA